MRRIIALVAAALAMTVLATGARGQDNPPVGPQAIVCTTYWVSGSCINPTYGSATSNGWKVSASYARRYHHWVFTQTCLPSYAQFEVMNIAQNGSQINSHRSAPGSCGFDYPLTSNDQYAKAACRILSSGAPVTRTIACMTQWN